MGTHPIFESDFDCLTVLRYLESATQGHHEPRAVRRRRSSRLSPSTVLIPLRMASWSSPSSKNSSRDASRSREKLETLAKMFPSPPPRLRSMSQPILISASDTLNI